MKKTGLLLALLLCAVLLQAKPTILSHRLAVLANDPEKQRTAVAVLIKGDALKVRQKVLQLGGLVKFNTGNITSATLACRHLLELSTSDFVERMEEGRVQLQTLNDKMLVNNRIDMVHAGAAPLPQGYDGSGVIVGIIDTGIDFTHPDFKDSTGNSRVLWIWDHLLPDSTNTPQPFNYGQEFSKAAIDAGNAVAHVDQTAHGTHVTGIAAANGDSLIAFKGAAPKADIIAVALNFNQNDDTWLSSISDAVAYIFHKADSLNQPCVINISAGTYLGSHDGKDLAAQSIDQLITSQNGRMVVAAAGNAGNYPLHLRHTLNSDTLFTWFRKTGGNPIYIECWADTADLNQVSFAIGADQSSPVFANRGQLGWTTIQDHLGILGSDTIFSQTGNRLAIVQTYGQLIGDRYSMIFVVNPDSTTYYFRLMSAGIGFFDTWSFEMVFNGLPSASIYPGIVDYKLPDLSQTICSSFQCSDVVISAGQYVNRNNYIDVNGNLQTFATTEGAIGASSSRGPTRDGRTKPDLASTGEVTLASLKLSSAAWFLANQPFKLAQGGIHIRDGGTSSAAPAVAGAIALYLQGNPTADWQDIRNRTLLCTKRDNFTGNNLPNNTWGHGKLDAVQLISGCNALGIEQVTKANVKAYPNPASGQIFLQFDEAVEECVVNIFNPLGQQIRTESPTIMDRTAQLEVTGLLRGLYFLQINMKNRRPLCIPVMVE